MANRCGLHLVSVALVVALGSLLTLANSVPRDNPVRSAQEDLITSLPGLTSTPNFKQYSGYLNADDSNNRFWHYWFVESQEDPEKDPLVLWLNGGPGCSSLLGLLTELGPFRVTANGSLEKNDFSWNTRANVIFMESPVTVGFSYAKNGDTSEDDDTTAKANHMALRSFLEKFPQYKGRPLYLTGESYGGVYLPTLASLVDDDPQLNLKGVAIGNGYLNANILTESLIFFTYYHGLIGKTVWDGLAKTCCHGKEPARGQCDFLQLSQSPDCAMWIDKATQTILDSGINPYNLYDRCANPDQLLREQQQQLSHGLTREAVDRSLMRHALQRSNSSSLGLLSNLVKPKRGEKFRVQLQDEPPCTDDAYPINWLNKPDVQEALHIPKGLPKFATCSDSLHYTMIYPGEKDGLKPQMMKLIASKRKLNLLVYNGDVDLMCNFIGDEWFVDDLGSPLVSDYQPWKYFDQIAGYSKVYKGITFKTIKGSGHMVPGDKPGPALAMFLDFIGAH